MGQSRSGYGRWTVTQTGGNRPVARSSGGGGGGGGGDSIIGLIVFIAVAGFVLWVLCKALLVFLHALPWILVGIVVLMLFGCRA